MELDAHKRNILRAMHKKFMDDIARDEEQTQISTDAERTKIAYDLPEPEDIFPDEDDLEDDEELLEALNNI